MRLLKINIFITAMLVALFAVSCNMKTTKKENKKRMAKNAHKSAITHNGNNKNHSSDKAKSLFNSWDTNSDGVLTRTEFINQLGGSNIFKQWDANGNGSISKREWNGAVKNYLYTYSKGDYGKFNTWDENGNGVIGEDEFDNAIFEFVDHNSNDKISEKEFVNWFGWWPGNENNS